LANLKQWNVDTKVEFNEGGNVYSDPLKAESVDTKQNWGPDQSCVDDAYYTICDLMNQLQQQQCMNTRP